MPAAPSFVDMVDQYIAEAQARRPTLLFADGDISEANAHGAAAIGDAVLRYAAQQFKNTFIDGAKGDALTALVDDHLNLQRAPATTAVTVARFTRTGGGAATTIPIGTTVATTPGDDGVEVRFTTDVLQAVGLGNNGPFDVPVTCTVIGRGGNVAAATINRILASLSFGPWTVTNIAAAGGGNEEESDNELRLRARNFYSTLRRGTLAALEFGALQVASVRISRAIESETGLVTLVVSDADGNSTAQMISDVITEIENWRAAGTVINVVGAAPLLVDVTGTLVVADGVDASVLAPMVEAAIDARMRKLRQGETFFTDMAKAAGIAVDPDGIEALPISAPTADVTPLSYQVVRPGTISITPA